MWRERERERERGGGVGVRFGLSDWAALSTCLWYILAFIGAFNLGLWRIFNFFIFRETFVMVRGGPGGLFWTFGKVAKASH